MCSVLLKILSFDFLDYIFEIFASFFRYDIIILGKIVEDLRNISMSKKSNKFHQTTIREIAELAGVSTATVSRVLNTPEKTSEAVQDKVMHLVEKYNYVPNQMVKNIFSKTSTTIAVFVYDMNNPFFTSIIFALNRYAFAQGYHLIICDTENNPEREAEYLRYCQSTRVNSLILTEGASSKICELAANSTWITLLDRTFKDKDYPTVTSDSKLGIRTSIDYLENLNHSKIAFIAGPQQTQTGIHRLNAFTEYMKERKLPIPPEYIFRGDFSVKTGYNALEYFLSLKEKPTAIICSNDEIAKGVVFRANALGVIIPDNLSIIGFDGTSGDYFYPKLTTVSQDIEEIARLLMHEATEGKLNNSTTKHIVPVKLVIGDTCKRIT